MPRGRSTFTKRQKEHTRQQRQKDKAERRSQRKLEKPEVNATDELEELRANAKAQAALFQTDSDHLTSTETPTSANDTND